MRIAFIILASFFFFHAFGQKQQMEFVEGDWQTLLDKAKKEKKPFFVDFYTEWCGWCKVMEKKTFNTEEVISYVEKNYLAYQIDAEKGEGIGLRQKYGINSFPTILIFDKDGNMVMRVLGYQDINSFLAILEENKGGKSKSSGAVEPAKGENKLDAYFNAKNDFYEKLDDLINSTKNEQIKSMEEKAYAYGKENNHFDYSELQYVADKDFEIPLKNRLEMYYHMGRGDKDRMAVAAKAAIYQGEFGLKESHLILLLLLKNNIADVEMLVAINQLTYKTKDYQLLDTKAAIQFFVGDEQDAQDTAKKALKIGQKEDLDVSSTEILLNAIQ